MILWSVRFGNVTSDNKLYIYNFHYAPCTLLSSIPYPNGCYET